MSTIVWKLTKEEVAFEKKLVGKTPEEKKAIEKEFYEKKVAKALKAQQKRHMKNLKMGKISCGPKVPTFSTSAGSDYDRIKTFNDARRY